MMTLTQPAPSVERGFAHYAKFLVWPFVLWIAYVYLWYLQYKFAGHPGSTYLFTILTDWLGVPGHEKAMRIGTGTAELIAATMLFVPRLQLAGAVFSLGIMTGAIFFHVVSPLGIDPYNDGAVLFKEACATWVASAAIVAIRYREALTVWTLLREYVRR
jgi:hypothetical protein